MIVKVIIFIAFYSLTLFIFVLAISNYQINHDLVFSEWITFLIHSSIIFFASALFVKYFIYMFLSPLYDIYIAWKYKNIPDKYGNRPKVSILIPAWNEEVWIVSTIQSVLNSNYNNLEVIVINDWSTDWTESKILKFLDEIWDKYIDEWKQVIYKYKDNWWKWRALNKALEISTGSIVISVDADCLVDSNAVWNFVRYFDDPDVMAAVWNVKIWDTTSFIWTVQYLEFLFSFYFKKAEALMWWIYIIWWAAWAFRREVFSELGGYCTVNITEDIELTMRIQDAWYKIIYASDSLVYTEPASDMKWLIAQRFRWKIGKAFTFMKYKNLFCSMKKKHNKMLSFIVLPYSLFSEVQLSLEVFFIIFLFIYTYLSRDYTIFISLILLVSFMFLMQIVFSGKDIPYIIKIYIILLSLIWWVVLYVSTYIELNALFRTAKCLLLKRDVIWQKWSRKWIC